MESFCKELPFFSRTYSNVNPAQTLEVMSIIEKIMSIIVLVKPIMFATVLYACLPVAPDTLLVLLATGLSFLGALVEGLCLHVPMNWVLTS